MMLHLQTRCWQGRSTVATIKDITLPDDEADDVPMSADLYFPGTSQEHQAQHSDQASPLPLVIVLPGLVGPKELFSGTATHLAHAGYAVMPVSQPRDLTGTRQAAIVVRRHSLYAPPTVTADFLVRCGDR